MQSTVQLFSWHSMRHNNAVGVSFPHKFMFLFYQLSKINRKLGNPTAVCIEALNRDFSVVKFTVFLYSNTVDIQCINLNETVQTDLLKKDPQPQWCPDAHTWGYCSIICFLTWSSITKMLVCHPPPMLMQPVAHTNRHRESHLLSLSMVGKDQSTSDCR